MVNPSRNRFEQACEIYKVGKGEPYTHLLQNGMLGGKLNIPDSVHTEFLDLYAECIQKNYELYVIEHKTTHFKYMIDVDLYSTINDNSDTIIMHIQAILFEIFSEWYTAFQARVIVSSAESREVVKNGTNYIKTGLHLIWPEIVINAETAMALRNILVYKLREGFGERHSMNTWADVIDISIYKHCGLRMNYSWKMEECDCKKEDLDAGYRCPKCNNRRRVGAKRIYKPTLILDGKNKMLTSTLKKMDNNMNFSIKECSIRVMDCSNEENAVKVVIDKSKYPYASENAQGGMLAQRKTQRNTQFPNETNNPMRKMVEPGSAVYTALKNFMFNAFDGLYKKDEITHIYKCCGGEYHIICLDSRFCMNLGREHKNNKVYIYIDKNNMYQKCNCTCETTEGRKNGMCKDYRSSGRKLSNSVKSKLYPNYSSAPMFAMSEIEILEQLNAKAFDVITKKKTSEQAIIEQKKRNDSIKKKTIRKKRES